MTRTRFASAFLVMTVAAVCAACASPHTTTTEITQADLRARALRVAGPGTEGRAAGSEDARAVAGWIRSEFERMGLSPVDLLGHGTANHIHPFATPVANLADSGRNRLTVRRGADETVFQAGRDWMPFIIDDPRCFRTGVGEVVFVGLGHDEGTGEWNDYSGDVAGRVALAFRGVPPGTEDTYAGESAFNAKYEAARQHGATALLICNDPSWSRRYGDAVGFAGVEIEIVDDLPCAYVSQHLARKILGCSKAAFARMACAARRRPAPRVIERTYVDLSIDVEMDASPVNRNGENVIGMVPGTEGRAEQGFLVVGAHYDHIGRAFNWETTGVTFGGHDARGAIHAGADDNASGVAVMLELAEWFSDPKHRLRCPIVFVAFGSEELGLLGSTHAAHAPFFKPTLLMLNLDMVGREPRDALLVEGTSSWEGLVGVVHRSSGVLDGRWPICTSISDGIGPTSLPTALEAFDPVSSDHRPFFESGQPYLAITTGLSHDDYHRPRDTVDKLDTTVMKHVAEFCCGVLVELGTSHVEALRAATPIHTFAAFGAEVCRPLCKTCRQVRGQCPGFGCEQWSADLERATQALAAQGVTSLETITRVDGISVEKSGESVEALLVDAVRFKRPFAVELTDRTVHLGK